MKHMHISYSDLNFKEGNYNQHINKYAISTQRLNYVSSFGMFSHEGLQKCTTDDTLL